MQMKKISKFLGIVLTIAIVITSLPFTAGQLSIKADAASSDSNLSLTRPSASVTVTEVTRVAYASNTMQPPSGSNSEIVKATPSGIPYMTGTYASRIYAGETPVATTVTFTPGVELDSDPTVSCSNTTVKMSSPVFSNGTYSWTILSGTAMIDTALIFTVSYNYSEVNAITGKTYSHSYQTRAISYVESIATPAGSYSTKRTYEDWGLGTTTQNRSYLASLILGKNTYGSIYNSGTADGTLNFSANWSTAGCWTSAYGMMKSYSGSDASRNYNVGFKADGNRTISYVYMDKSIQSTLSDLNLRWLTVVPAVASESDERTTDSVNGVFVTSGINQTFSESDTEDDPTNDASTAAVLGIGSPTVASLKAIGSSSLMYFTGTGPSSGTADYTVAVKYQTAAGWAGVYVGHTQSLQINVYDKGKLRTLVENIQNLDPPRMTTSIIAEEYKGHNPQSWYFASGYEDFLNAYNHAIAILSKPRTTQSEIDAAETALFAKFKLLKLAKADYTYANIYRDQAATLNENNYTLSSWAKLQTALNSYVDNYSILYQPAVDKIAVDIENAINNLEYKPADYSELNQRLSTINEMSNTAFMLYGKSPENVYNNWNSLIATITNSGCVFNDIEGYVVASYLPITKQATVDGYVVLIDGAISKATLKGADLTEAMAAESRYNSIVPSQVVDDIAEQLYNAYTGLVALHNADISQQAEVDSATQNLNYWLDNIEYKPADISRAITAIQNANAIDRSLYEDMTAVDDAVAVLESKLDLDIRYQSEVNSAINALQSAIDKLTTNTADYSVVDDAIERANNVDRQTMEQYGYSASVFYSNWTNVTNAINSVTRGLDATNQETVDNYAIAIDGALDALEESVADYSQVNALSSAANNIITNESHLYKEESITNLLNACLSVQSGYLISRQAEVDEFAVAIQEAIDSLEYVEANYSNVNTKLTQANSLLNTAAQYEEEHPGYVYYTEESKAELEIALASVITGLDITQQSVVNGYVTLIDNAINALVCGPADYSKVDLAIANVPGDTSMYTTLTVATLNASIKAVNRTYTADKQSTVDNYATKIDKAVASLKYKTADYTLVNAAKNNVPADHTLYTEESWQLVQDAVDAVVTNRPIIYQDEVDMYATAINDAVAALKYKPADYTAVEQAIACIPDNIENYSDETVSVLNDVLSSIDYSLDITQQAEVDAYIGQINSAVSGLVLKQADYSEFYRARANALTVIENGDYTQSSIDAVNDIIDNAELDLDITQQSTVDGYVSALNEALANLVASHADYSALNSLKATWDNYLEKEYLDENKVTAVNTAFANVDYTLDASQQAVVDGYVSEISGLISSLTYRDGDYTAVYAALARIPSDLSLFTSKSVSTVTSAAEAVEYGLDARSQSAIDAYAAEIENAVSGLEYKAANYTNVYNALSRAPSDVSLYTDESVSTLNELMSSIPTVTDIREQYILDKYAEDILAAIDGLTYKNADYSQADEAIRIANEMIATGWYTDESVAALNLEIGKLNRNLDITYQNEVDICTNNIVKATNELTKNLANYTELQNLLELLDNSASEIYNYTYSNYAEVMGEVSEYRENTVSSRMNLTIDRQNEVDEMVEYLQGLIDSLIKVENGEIFEAKDGSTTIISKGYIYGLKSGLTKSNFESDFVTMSNVDVTYSNDFGPFLGTGAKVIVKSAVTGVQLGEYTIVIFGDVDGNAKVDVFDMFAVESAVESGLDGASLKAADLNGDGGVTDADLTLFKSIIGGTAVLDRATGEVK